MLASRPGYWQSWGLCLEMHIPFAVSKTWTLVAKSSMAGMWVSKMGRHWKILRTSDTFGRERNFTNSLGSSNIEFTFDREHIWVQSFATSHGMDPKIHKQLQSQRGRKDIMPTLAVRELKRIEEFWCWSAHEFAFFDGISRLKTKGKLRLMSKLLTFNPFLDKQGLLRVGGRIWLADLPYKRRHPNVLPVDHRLTKLVIKSEHEWLLHAGSPIVSALLSQRFCILNSRQAISCIKCRKVAARPNSQVLGQLPADRVKPGLTFNCVGVDYSGPMLTKSGPICKTVFKKA